MSNNDINSPLNYNINDDRGEEMFTICVTGHRPDKLPGGYDIYNPLNKKLVNMFRDILLSYVGKTNCIHCISGMGLGADQLFTIACIGLKQEGYQIFLEAAIPCLAHDKLWPKASKELYQQLLETCDKITYVTKEPYKPIYMQLRNQYMVDNSDLVIGVYDGSEGGTKNCLDYAEKRSVEILEIDPKDIYLY